MKLNEKCIPVLWAVVSIELIGNYAAKGVCRMVYVPEFVAPGLQF